MQQRVYTLLQCEMQEIEGQVKCIIINQTKIWSSSKECDTYFTYMIGLERSILQMFFQKTK